MRLATRRRVGTLAVLAPPLAWALLFMIAPYAIMFAYSFYRKQAFAFVPELNLDSYMALLLDPQYRLVLLRTLKIALLVSVSALVLAYPLAYFLVFKVRSARLRLFLYMAVIVPLWVSYLLRAYTWKTILGSEGVLNSFFLWAGVLSEPSPLFIYNQFSMVLTLTYIFIPFMVMPIYTSLEKIPRSLIEASGDLGVGPTVTFLRITLPLSVPGILAGATFTFCLTFGDFVTPFLVGGPNGTLVANTIQSQFGIAFNWPLGAALSIVMLAIVIFIISTSDRFERAGRLDLA
ncbi:MAG TPA: ABC transporter permease [Pseudolabrys sp.]|nr:ABC transporter permease [Pseudolabrys sp.]